MSTDKVYGSLSPNDPAFSETTAYAPNSPYCASKATSDHLVRAYHHTHGLATLLINCSNNYGPRQFPEKLIPLMVINAVEGKPLPVYGDGLKVRDCCCRSRKRRCSDRLQTGHTSNPMFERLETAVPGVLIIKPRVFADARGCFYETYHGASSLPSGLPTHLCRTTTPAPGAARFAVCTVSVVTSRETSENRSDACNRILAGYFRAKTLGMLSRSERGPSSQHSAQRQLIRHTHQMFNRVGQLWSRLARSGPISQLTLDFAFVPPVHQEKRDTNCDYHKGKNRNRVHNFPA